MTRSPAGSATTHSSEDLGEDTAAFLQNLGQYTLQDFGSRILVSGPDGDDQLFSVEHLRFADTTLTPVEDGDPLFDSLYYYSRNTDVYFAGVNARDTSTPSAGTKDATRTRCSTPRAISR